MIVREGFFDYQKRMGKFLENAIPQHVIEKRNSEKSWSYGYDEEFDTVIISKDGTLGQVYELQGLQIGLPAEPEKKTDILGFQKETINQKWQPPVFSKELLNVEREALEWNEDRANKDNFKTPTDIFYGKPKTFIDRHLPTIIQDFERREKGMWVYINGKATYIVGCHYFMLTHIPVQGKTLPYFRFSNLDLYTFWEACMADERSLGIIKIKGRREGASTMAGAECINRGSQLEEGFIGIVSKSNKDSASLLTRMVIRPFKKLAWWVKPRTSGTSSATSGLVFRAPAKKMSAKNMIMTEEEGLDTSIRQYATALNSLDGEEVDLAILDESGKYPAEVPFSQYMSIVGAACTKGFKITGKAFVVSTVNALNKGGQEYKDVYYASDVTKRTESGMTGSGLYSLFMSAAWTMEGSYDEFGYSIYDTPKYPVKNEEGKLIKLGSYDRIVENQKFKKRLSAVIYNEYLRQYPLSESHAFRDEAEQSMFNLNKIYEQMDHNEMLRPSPIERGNFRNISDDPLKPEIEWVVDYKGRFYMSWMPPKELRNNFQMRGGLLTPMNDFACLGVDPYKVSKTVDKRGSKGAIHASTGDSSNIQEIPDNKVFLEYIERPLTVDMFIEDAINVMLFLGIPALIESNVRNLLEELRRRGLTKFALRRKDKLKISPDEKLFGGIPMTGEKVVQDHYFVLQKLVQNHVGIDDEGKFRDVGQMSDFYFNRTLMSLSKFSPENRTSEDASISLGLSRMGLKMMNKQAQNISIKSQSEFIEGWSKLYKY